MSEDKSINIKINLSDEISSPLNMVYTNIMRIHTAMNSIRNIPNIINSPMPVLSESLELSSPSADSLGLDRIDYAREEFENILNTQRMIMEQSAKTEIISISAVQNIISVKEELDELRKEILSINETPVSNDIINIRILPHIDDDFQQINTAEQTLNSIVQSRAILSQSEGIEIIPKTAVDNVIRLKEGLECVLPVTEMIKQIRNDNIINIQILLNIDENFQQINMIHQSLNDIIQIQEQIAANAQNIEIIPQTVLNDLIQANIHIQSISSSIGSISHISNNNNILQLNQYLINILSTIEEINQNPIGSIAETREILNQLRLINSSLNEIISGQQELNEILEQTGNTISDNINGQRNFNNHIINGTSAASGLMNTIKGAVAAYLSFRGIKSALGLSDEMSNTEARLNLINDGLNTTEELNELIFASAERSRGSYQSTADAVSKLGLQAGQAFSGTEEIIAFVEQLNKQFTIAGTGVQGIDSVMLQLTQSMASGKLQGEELNAVLDNAQPIVQKIKDYMRDVLGYSQREVDAIKDLASKGKITSDVLKNALLYYAEETNEQFEKMPMTFSQLWTHFKNHALMAFRPVLKKLNEIANNKKVATFVNGLINIMYVLGNVAEKAVDVIVSGIETIADIWENYGGIITTSIALVIGAVTAWTIAQWALNTSLYSCPLVWIIGVIILLVAIIYFAVDKINETENKTVSAAGVIFGALGAVFAYMWNQVISVWQLILKIIDVFVNVFIDFANFLSNVFKDPISSIIHLFNDMGIEVIEIVEKIAQAIDNVFGTKLAAGVMNFKNKLSTINTLVAEKLGNGKYEKVLNRISIEDKLKEMGISFDRMSYTNTAESGYNIGKKIDGISDIFNKLNGLAENKNPFNFDSFGSTEGIDSIDKVNKVGKVSGTVDVSNEDLRLLKDIASQKAIIEVHNNTVVPKLNVTFGDVRESADVKKIVKSIETLVKEGLESGASGAY